MDIFNCPLKSKLMKRYAKLCEENAILLICRE